MPSTKAPEMPAAAAAPVRPRPRRIAVVINAASGSVGPDAAPVVERLVAERGHDLTVYSPEPHDIEAAVRDAVAGAPDLLLVLAGDGTARLAAQLCGAAGPLVAPLPGGTLNMLPRALYGDVNWRQALVATLDHGVERCVCGGRINGLAFYCAAILGSPALWGHAREAVRKGNFAEAFRRARFALRRAFTGGLHYALDGRPRRDAEALILISPLVSKAMTADTALEVAGLDMHSAQEVFRLAFNGLTSDWRRDPGVIDETSLRGRVWARRSIPAILDGEIQRLPRGAEFVFDSCAFRALVQPRESDSASQHGSGA
jgi:diacylglycerol kinase family enzyme